MRCFEASPRSFPEYAGGLIIFFPFRMKKSGSGGGRKEGWVGPGHVMLTLEGGRVHCEVIRQLSK